MDVCGMAFGEAENGRGAVARVPGAGGYDAIWLLVCDPPNCAAEELPATRVERVWSTYRGLDVSPLLAAESVAKGVRVEAVDAVPGLAAIVREQ